ncbi:MAG: methylenetetrahydrofolate--tRNA-(uracil(54)-C(5))-methyltransferase (FADH(2)-oxidizing) TrmFO, partial [Chitinispirillaceae bacterium]|nr:methylenetetrahydrofolate--tRNA-(uracil(54)-C(5))-methyltransferase (FADH(2)-oxidizing) TrmFO [Chitinispirillaceae bacterium]
MTDNQCDAVAVIGAGLAGCEAALVLSRLRIPVALYEARPHRMTPAHTTALPAELVCSNSFKSSVMPSAHGLLKAELRVLESPLLAAATDTALPAGKALAVDRERFSLRIKERITATPLITYINNEMEAPPSCHRYCIIAAGPLASEKLTSWLQQTFSTDALHFYDAIAPIVASDSIDHSIAFTASRWKRGEGDYLNCPFSEAEYRLFYDALRKADQVTAREFEAVRFFESCLPIEVAAKRGYRALAFGPLRPVGITDPRTGKRPFAVCQLRRERVSGESYNLVGCQTRLTVGEQQRVFRLV